MLRQALKTSSVAIELTEKAVTPPAEMKGAIHPQSIVPLDVRHITAEIDQRVGRTMEDNSELEDLLNNPTLRSNPILLAKTLNNLGNTYLRQFEHSAAVRYLDEAIKLLKIPGSIEARNQLGIALSTRGAAKMSLRDFDSAYDDFAHSRIALKGSFDKPSLAELDNRIGVFYALLGRNAEALPYFHRAAEQAKQNEDILLESRARINLVSNNLVLLNPEVALDQQPRLTELLRQAPNNNLHPFINIILSQALIANGRLVEAGEILDQTRLDLAKEPDHLLNDRLDLIAAEHAFIRGNHPLAIRLARAGLTSQIKSRSEDDFAKGLLVLINSQLAQGDMNGAARTMFAAKRWQPIQSTISTASIVKMLIEAQYAVADGDYRTGRTSFKQAMGMTKTLQMPAIELLVSSAFSKFLIETGDLDQAVVVAAQSGDWAERSYDAALLQLQLHHARSDLPAWQSARRQVIDLAMERPIPAQLLSPPTEQSAIQ